MDGTGRRWTRGGPGLLGIVVAVGSACSMEAYHLGDYVEDVAGDVVEEAEDAEPEETAEVCIPSREECNEADDDCDGETDEDFDLERDPVNCGACGVECDRPNTLGTCEAGECAFACQPGWSDLNDDMGDGCEYPCVPTGEGGVEECDGFDNDCDGRTDEGFDLLTSLDHCGECHRRCVGLHAVPSCVAGECMFECEEGYRDLLPDVPGCEYTCPRNPPEAELCNAVDDDCDTVVDNGDPGAGVACGPDEGECASGSTICRFGTVVCAGAVGPRTDVCDDLDNDCDGLTDEDFDKLSDPNHCGGCAACDLYEAIAGCSGGTCTVVACRPGFHDIDGDPANGCEYGCMPSGPELCDGLDNDCDTLIDLADDAPPPAGLWIPPNFCASAGPCAGTEPVCGTTACDPDPAWRCIYSVPAEVDSCGNLPADETLCDDIDGDCDGAMDETFLLKGTACADDGLGRCRGTGSYVCNSAGDGVICDITSPGGTSATETCNGIDDNCDGVLDNGAMGAMVHVTGGGMDFWIDTYEASRPDATPATAGTMSHQACSNADVLPWRNITWTAAAAACTAAGKRLCTEAEWEQACAGIAGLRYPYGNAYNPNICNGVDYDPDCTAPDSNACLPTGTPYGCPPPPTSGCVSPWGAVDLSGNVKEWTATQVSPAPPTYRIRGGSYDSIAGGLTCQFAFVSAEETYFYGNLGFRCCSDTGP